MYGMYRVRIAQLVAHPAFKARRNVDAGSSPRYRVLVPGTGFKSQVQGSSPRYRVLVPGTGF